jgi:hypothetical protein
MNHIGNPPDCRIPIGESSSPFHRMARADQSVVVLKSGPHGTRQDSSEGDVFYGAVLAHGVEHLLIYLWKKWKNLIAHSLSNQDSMGCISGCAARQESDCTEKGH